MVHATNLLPPTKQIKCSDTEIKKFEEFLSNMNLVYDFYIHKLNNKNVFYKITYNGSPDHFLKIMKNKNYKFDIQDQIWALK